MSSEASADCIIVGSGIGGAVLALILGREKKRVVILEREAAPFPQPRPEIHARATMETFRRLGLADRILSEAAMPLEGLRMRGPAQKVLIEFTTDDFKTLGVQPYSVDPTVIRALLLEEAVKTGCVDVRHGVEVQELQFHGMHVKGVRAIEQKKLVSWTAPLVVGDDGSHSRIRRNLAIPIRLKEFAVDFMSQAGPEFFSIADPVRGQAWINPRKINASPIGCLLMPQPKGRAALLFIASPGVRKQIYPDGDAQAFHEAATALSPACAELNPALLLPKRFAVFRRPFGHARRYTGHGVALMGDAAHPVTPAGGQGANMSVADAVALGKTALKAYEANDFSREALAPYEAERRPANHRSLQFSIIANRFLTAMRFFPPLSGIVLSMLENTGQDLEKKRRFLQRVSHAFESPA